MTTFRHEIALGDWGWNHRSFGIKMLFPGCGGDVAHLGACAQLRVLSSAMGPWGMLIASGSAASSSRSSGVTGARVAAREAAMTESAYAQPAGQPGTADTQNEARINPGRIN